LRRVPSFLDDAISAAQNRLGIVNKPPENNKKAATRPSLLELNFKSKPRISLPIQSQNKKSWLTKHDDEVNEFKYKDNSLNKKSRGPIWKVALDELNKTNENPQLTTVNHETQNIWPPLLSINIRKNMNNWHVVEENRQLTKTMESIIQRPGSHLNPIHIKGDTGVGKTHISLATCYEIQSIYGDESVRIIRSGTLIDNSKELPKFKNKNIIANANCSVIPIVVALKPLHDLYNVKRIVASTYQSVSGAGKAGMDELISQTKEVLENKNVQSKNFTKQIAFNAIPHIDSFLENGSTKEEQKNHDEVKKILDNKISITSTCVRIPVLVSHSISVNVEFNKKHNLEEVKTVLSSSPGCKVVDEHKDGGYITPVEAEDKFETFVSRIRDDSSQPNSINMWIVSDNLLKGAALNAVEIAEALIEKDFYGR